MTADRPTRSDELVTIVKFGIVGVASTLVYLAVSFVLLGTRALPPGPVNAIALVAGIVFSYCGHYYFTYRRPGRHTFFGPRFVTVTAIVFCGSIALEQALNRWLQLSPYHTSFAIAVAYPVASFLLNHFWAFLRGRGAH